MAKEAIVNPATGYVVPFGEAEPDKTAQEQLADHLYQEFRNRHVMHGGCPRDMVEEAVGRVLDKTKDTPPDFSSRQGVDTFLDSVRDEMDAPRDDYLGQLQEWQRKSGFF